LALFPLFDGAFQLVEYTLSDHGIASGVVTVEEVSASGSVPELLVENKGDIRVLFLEGEELIGAKQNRILNTSVRRGNRANQWARAKNTGPTWGINGMPRL
jgi:hypothetical protein